ncbi:MAG TPA: exodeoxyribonuclease V subunit alpha, partial [Gammaproteobacteria bacterium]|nr:exodeoxyribonuclease V subunit alpha [Gammaproteobacteria bacterium]
GSEYRHVALLLPSQPNRVLSRELLYTAITRARDELSVHGDAGVWRMAVENRVQRHSGLGERLYGKPT